MTLAFLNSHCHFLTFLHVRLARVFNIKFVHYGHQSEQFNVIVSNTQQQKYVWFKQLFFVCL